MGDKDSNVRRRAVEIFIAAVAQGAFNCRHRILMQNRLQRAFGTAYLTLRSSPQLDVH